MIDFYPHTGYRMEGSKWNTSQIQFCIWNCDPYSEDDVGEDNLCPICRLKSCRKEK